MSLQIAAFSSFECVHITSRTWQYKSSNFNFWSTSIPISFLSTADNGPIIPLILVSYKKHFFWLWWNRICEVLYFILLMSKDFSFFLNCFYWVIIFLCSLSFLSPPLLLIPLLPIYSRDLILWVRILNTFSCLFTIWFSPLKDCSFFCSLIDLIIHPLYT